MKCYQHMMVLNDLNANRPSEINEAHLKANMRAVRRAGYKVLIDEPDFVVGQKESEPTHWWFGWIVQE